ncbi:MAG: peroxiredoxin family protein [Pirellulaceae bacterium]
MALVPQDEPDANQDELLVTVKGKFVLDSDQVAEFDWTSMAGSLVENVEFQQPEFPESWQEMSLPDRQAWITEFEASEAGKQMLAANSQLLNERNILEFDVDEQGKFVVYDVPPGQYSMQAAGQLENDGRIYILQAFGQMAVEEVDELDLSSMPVEVMRLLRMGEDAPEVAGVDEANDDCKLSGFRGQHVLLAFGIFGNPAFQQTAAALREAAESSESADQLKVVAVSLDEDREQLLEVLEQHPVPNCIALGGWDRATLSEYGIKQLPAFWLIDPEGKIVLTGQQFLFELNRTQFSLVKLVDEAIAGRLKIGGEATEEDEATKDGDDK